MTPPARAETLGEAIRQGTTEHAGCHLIVDSDERPHRGTLGELGAEGLEVAAWLQSLGVGRGDVVALQLPNWWEGAVFQAAAALAGAVILPIVPVYGAREVSFILRESRAKVFALPSGFRGRAFAGMLDDLGDLPDLVATVVVGDEVPDGSVSWTAAHLDPATYQAPVVSPDDLTLLVYTSGTTADPKGVQHTHRSLLAETWSPVVMAGTGPGSSHLSVFPSGHVAAVNGLLRILVLGSPTVLMDAWGADRAAQLIDDYQVTVTAGAPVHLAGFLDARERGEIRLTSLREYLVGGASVPPALVERADAAGIVAYRAYGLSEHPTISGSTASDPLVKRAHTDGRVQPGNEVRILDDDGNVLGRDQDGEIVSRGSELFAGYRDSGLDETSFTDDGWFRTGDIGRLDADGYLTITDRKKDIIVRGGENFSSKEIEDVLGSHARVAEVAAVGAPDERYGERVAVFVVLREGTDLSLDEIGEHFRAAGVARQKTPEVVRVVEVLPRTPAGKIQKVPLRTMLIESLS
ncbi:MAG: fadK 1 [Marmoricola sp.]|nr:fadK 1 [Marmoricola sp.]